MKNLYTLLLILFFQTIGICQSNRDAIAAVVEEFFQALNTKDANRIETLTSSTALLYSHYYNTKGIVQTNETPIGEFIASVENSGDDEWNEVIDHLDIKIDLPYASAWMDYTFYLNSELLHCGINHFLFLKKDTSWIITEIRDTRRRSNCSDLIQKQFDNNEKNLIDKQVWIPFIESYNKADPHVFNSLHTKDVLRISKHGIIQGDEYKKRNIESFERNKTLDRGRKIELYLSNRVVQDSLAYDIGFYRLTYTWPNTKKEAQNHYGQFHVLLKKEKGIWRIAQDQDLDMINGEKINERHLTKWVSLTDMPKAF